MSPLRKAMIREMELRRFHKSTKEQYVRHAINFAQHFGKSPENLGAEEIKEYLHYLITKCNRKISYVHTVYSALKFLYSTILQRDWDSYNIPRGKREKRLPVVLSPSEVQAILNSVSNLKHKAILMTIYATGLRISEAVNLKLNDIDSDNKQIHVRLGKGQKDRYCLLSEINLEVLRTYYKKYKPVEWLFNGKYPGQPISIRAIQALFDKARRKAGIRKKASVHTLRHSFATHLLESGANIVQIQQLMGHSNINTTTIYLHLQKKDLLEIVSPLDKLTGIQ